jgi:hypothetical protein
MIHEAIALSLFPSQPSQLVTSSVRNLDSLAILHLRPPECLSTRPLRYYAYAVLGSQCTMPLSQPTRSGLAISYSHLLHPMTLQV